MIAGGSSVNLFTKIVRFGYRLGFSPIGWDERSGLYVHRETLWRYVWLRFQLALLLCYQMLLGYKCWLVFSDPGKGMKEQCQGLYLVAVYVFMNYNHVVTIFNGAQYAQCVSSFSRLVKKASGSGLPKAAKEMRFGRVMLFLCTFASLQTFVSPLLRPDSARALTSLAEEPHKLTLSTRILVGIVQLSVTGSHFYSHCLQTTTVVCYAYELTALMQLLHNKNQTSGNVMEFSREHRALEVHVANFAQLYGTWMLAMEMFGLSMGIVNLYLAVEFRDMGSLILALGPTLCYCWVITELSEVYETSTGILEEWRRSAECGTRRQWSYKFLRSCKPIRMPNGSFFYIDRGFVLTVIAIIIDTAVNLILAE